MGGCRRGGDGEASPFLFVGSFLVADRGLGLGLRLHGGLHRGPLWASLGAETSTGQRPALFLRVALHR